MIVLKSTLDNSDTFYINDATSYKEIIIKIYLSNGFAQTIHIFPTQDGVYSNGGLLTGSTLFAIGADDIMRAYATIDTANNGLIHIDYTIYGTFNGAVKGYKLFARK